MDFFKKLRVAMQIALISICIAFTSCEEDLTTIGSGVISNQPFTTGKEVFDVYAFNKNIKAVQTNRLPVYQLGDYTDPVYGKTKASITSQVVLTAANPTFGVYTQSTEDGAATDDSDSTIDEEETVTQVYLYIPYLLKSGSRDTDLDGVEDQFDTEPETDNDNDGDGVNNSLETSRGTDPLDDESVDADGDGINDENGETIISNNFAKNIDIDSIYVNNKNVDELDGDILATFKLKVGRSTYFLRDYDPDTNFEDNQTYYSDQEFSPSFVTDIIYEDEVELSNKEFLIMNEDDAETEDEDESLVFTKLNPGIRVPLDTKFFQDNILDMEGSSELISQANFNEFIRGLHLTLEREGSTQDVMLLLDLTQASITVDYTYNSYNEDSESDNNIDKKESSVTLNLITASNGNAVNTFINDTYPTQIQEALIAETNASRILLKGGAGVNTQIHLFELNGAENVIERIKSENWIVNEANLVFYVDQDQVGNAPLPARLYLYNAESNAPLYNAVTERNETESLFGVYLNYDGIIDRSDSEQVKYTVRITEHINNMVVRDSTNSILGLSLTTDILNTTVAEVKTDNEELDVPRTATISPLGTVLYGSNMTAEDPNFDKKLKLEIFYTKTD